MQTLRALALLLPLPLAVPFAACGGNEPAPVSPGGSSASTGAPASTDSAAAAASASAAAASASAPPPEPPKPPAVLSLHDSGFQTPESVAYEPKGDVYLVSNINGGPSAGDNNGFISRVSPDGSKVELKWIEGGKKGVKLDAPKGLCPVGNVLYVADLTRVRMFDLASGAPKGEVALPGATFANDVTAGPDGKVYVSDSGIKIDEKGVSPTKSDAVYVIEQGKAKVIASGDELGHPNGLAWWGDKLWVVTFGTGELYSLDKMGNKRDAQALPKGQLDGLVPAADGTLLVSSWEASAIYRGKPAGTFVVVLPGVKAPADFGYDDKRGRVLVPLFQDNAVEAYELK